MFNRKYIFNGSIFHCYVSLPECKHYFDDMEFLGQVVLGKNRPTKKNCPAFGAGSVIGLFGLSWMTLPLVKKKLAMLPCFMLGGPSAQKHSPPGLLYF